MLFCYVPPIEYIQSRCNNVCASDERLSKTYSARPKMYYNRGVSHCQRHTRVSGPGAQTVKRRMRDSPHRSGDCLTTKGCGAS